MELSRKAVYPVHKLDMVSEDCVAHDICNDKNCLMEIGQVAESNDNDKGEELLMLDYRINPHYFDLPWSHKAKKNMNVYRIAKPNEVQKHMLGVRQDYFVIKDRKWDLLKKVGLYEPWKNKVIQKLDNMLKK